MKEREHLCISNKHPEPVTHTERRVIAAFIQNPQDYFHAEPTFKQSYTPQLGEIFSILKQMKESFETNLSDNQKEEVANQKAYEDLKAAKTDEIKVGQAVLSFESQFMHIFADCTSGDSRYKLISLLCFSLEIGHRWRVTCRYKPKVLLFLIDLFLYVSHLLIPRRRRSSILLVAYYLASSEDVDAVSAVVYTPPVQLS